MELFMKKLPDPSTILNKKMSGHAIFFKDDSIHEDRQILPHSVSDCPDRSAEAVLHSSREH